MRAVGLMHRAASTRTTQFAAAVLLMICGLSVSSKAMSLSTDVARRYVGPNDNVSFVVVIDGPNRDEKARDELARSIKIRFPGLREMKVHWGWMAGCKSPENLSAPVFTPSR
jgi:hypothetical protein